MKTWYQTREAVNLKHRNQTIPAQKKILLTPEQVNLHNSQAEKVVKSEPPKDATEAGVLDEYKEWLKANEKLAGFKTETPPQKSKTNTKAKSE